MSERSETESERDLDNIEVGDEILMVVMMMIMMMIPGPVRAGRGLQQEILPQERGRGCGRQDRVLPCAISGEKRLE